MAPATAVLPSASEHAIEALYATGHWLFMQQRVAQALSVFRAMVHLAPEDERGWLAIGFCYEAQNHPTVALTIYAAALELAQPAARCAVAQARILRSRGMIHEARRALAHAARAADAAGDDELRDLVASEWTRR
jgi:tetratricopeptide (TPR) repeat protein